MTKREDIENRFMYHVPKLDQARRYDRLRENTLKLALTFLELVPESREQSLAFTKLEEAVMFANAAIARNE